MFDEDQKEGKETLCANVKLIMLQYLLCSGKWSCNRIKHTGIIGTHLSSIDNFFAQFEIYLSFCYFTNEAKTAQDNQLETTFKLMACF